MWWPVLVILALRRLRKEDLEFKAIPGYIEEKKKKREVEGRKQRRKEGFRRSIRCQA
jgi:hypothetical protein